MWEKLKWVCDDHNKFWARVDFFVRAIYRMEVGTRARASERGKNECALELAVSWASLTATAYGVDATGRGFKPGRGRVLDCFNTRLFRK